MIWLYVILILIVVWVILNMIALAVRFNLGRLINICDTRGYIEELLINGHNKTVMRLRHPPSGYYVDFAKFCPKDGKNHIVMNIPTKSRAAKVLIEKIKFVLENECIEYEILELFTVYKFSCLAVECGLDLDYLERVAMIILIKAFEIESDASLRVGFRGRLSNLPHPEKTKQNTVNSNDENREKVD